MTVKTQYRDLPLPYQRTATPAVFLEGPSFQYSHRVVAGSNLLSVTPVPLNNRSYGASLISGAVGEKRWTSSEFVEARPLDAVRGFFDSVGSLWGQFSASKVTAENIAVKTPEGLTAAFCNMLATGAVVSGLPANHPAFFVIVAVALLSKLRDPNVNVAKVRRDFIRSFAVSFVKEGFERVTGFGGGFVTKTELRQIVMESLVLHVAEFIDVQDENQVETLRGWERGNRTDKPVDLNLSLPVSCDLQEFTARCNAVFRDLAIILKAAA